MRATKQRTIIVGPLVAFGLIALAAAPAMAQPTPTPPTFTIPDVTLPPIATSSTTTSVPGTTTSTLAPTTTSTATTTTTTTIPPARRWIDTNDRAAVLAFFHDVFDPAEPAPGWTGNIANCQAGTLAAEHRAGAFSRVNWYRSMAGVLQGIVEEPTFSARAQEAALITAANSSLNHDPPSTATCFTTTGRDGAQHSNLYLGRSGLSTIDGWMQDSGAGNVGVGHRRWILEPFQVRMGFGSIPAAPQAAALYVVDEANLNPSPPPPTRETSGFTSWPPRGYIPDAKVYPRWSLQRAGADFSSATVEVVIGGSAVQTTIENRAGALVFAPQLPTFPTEADLPVTVNVAGIAGSGVPATHSWTTTIIPTLTPPPPTTGGGPGRVGVINSCGASYVKEGFLTNGFQQQLDCGDAKAIALDDDRVGAVNSCGAFYVKEGDLSGPFQQQTQCNDASAITVSSWRAGVITGCGAAYVKDGILSTPFSQQLNCGDARALAVTDERVGAINSCGAFYVKEGALDSGFHQQTVCNDAQAIAVSPNRVAVITGCGALYVKEGDLSEPFQLQLVCGDARAVSLTDNRLGVMNSCGAYYVKEGSLANPYVQQTGCGDTRAIAVAPTRNAVINGCGALYVKEGSLSGPFHLQLNCGDGRAVALNNLF